MKAAVVISILLALECAIAQTATGELRADEPDTGVARVAADLTEYWQATLSARLASSRAPRSIVYYRNPIDTPCGTSTMHNARYCPGNDTIYLDQTWIESLLAAGDYTAVAVLAHEWGHEVQNELGDLDRSSERAYLRALELQADCFAGMFTRSYQDNGRIGVSAVDQARRFFLSAGDPLPRMRSHGTGAQRVAWFDAGYRSGSLDVCESVFRREHAMPRVPAE